MTGAAAGSEGVGSSPETLLKGVINAKDLGSKGQLPPAEVARVVVGNTTQLRQQGFLEDQRVLAYFRDISNDGDLQAGVFQGLSERVKKTETSNDPILRQDIRDWVLTVEAMGLGEVPQVAEYLELIRPDFFETDTSSSFPPPSPVLSSNKEPAAEVVRDPRETFIVSNSDYNDILYAIDHGINTIKDPRFFLESYFDKETIVGAADRFIKKATASPFNMSKTDAGLYFRDMVERVVRTKELPDVPVSKPINTKEEAILTEVMVQVEKRLTSAGITDFNQDRRVIEGYLTEKDILSRLPEFTNETPIAKLMAERIALADMVTDLYLDIKNLPFKVSPDKIYIEGTEVVIPEHPLMNGKVEEVLMPDRNHGQARIIKIKDSFGITHIFTPEMLVAVDQNMDIADLLPPVSRDIGGALAQEIYLSQNSDIPSGHDLGYELTDQEKAFEAGMAFIGHAQTAGIFDQNALINFSKFLFDLRKGVEPGKKDLFARPTNFLKMPKSRGLYGVIRQSVDARTPGFSTQGREKLANFLFNYNQGRNWGKGIGNQALADTLVTMAILSSNFHVKAEGSTFDLQRFTEAELTNATYEQKRAFQTEVLQALHGLTREEAERYPRDRRGLPLKLHETGEIYLLEANSMQRKVAGLFVEDGLEGSPVRVEDGASPLDIPETKAGMAFLRSNEAVKSGWKAEKVLSLFNDFMQYMNMDPNLLKERFSEGVNSPLRESLRQAVGRRYRLFSLPQIEEFANLLTNFVMDPKFEDKIDPTKSIPATTADLMALLPATVGDMTFKSGVSLKSFFDNVIREGLKGNTEVASISKFRGGLRAAQGKAGIDTGEQPPLPRFLRKRT